MRLSGPKHDCIPIIFVISLIFLIVHQQCSMGKPEDANPVDKSTSTDDVATKHSKTSSVMKAIQFLTFLLAVAGLYLYKTPSLIDPVAYKLTPAVSAPVTDILPHAEIVFKNRRLMRGPESITFDEEHDVGYVGTLDGRIMRLDMSAPHGSIPEVVANVGDPGKALPLPCGEYSTLEICGRVLGLQFTRTGKLVLADASRGLILLDQRQRRIDLLAGSVIPSAPGKRTRGSSKQREPIKLINSVALAGDGKIYFTLTSRKFGLKDIYLDYLEGKGNGALGVYDPSSKKASLIATDLHFPNGLVLIENETVALVSETGRGRVMRIALTKSAQMKIKRGNKAISTDDPNVTVWSDGLPTLPDNLSLVGDEVWAAGTSYAGSFRWLDYITEIPLIRKVITKAIPSSILMAFVPAESAIVRMNQKTGQVVGVFTTRGQKTTDMTTLSPRHVSDEEHFADQAMMKHVVSSNKKALSHLSGATYYKGYVYLTSFHPDSGFIVRFPWDAEKKEIPRHALEMSHKKQRALQRAEKLAQRKIEQEEKEKKQNKSDSRTTVEIKEEL